MVPRFLITGSRSWTDRRTIRWALRAARDRLGDGILVHGSAQGADRLAADVWSGWGLPVEPHPPLWREYGRWAGVVRNHQMVCLGADLCLAFIHDHSHGASHTASLARAAGVRTAVFEPGYADLLDRVARILRGDSYVALGPAERLYRLDHGRTLASSPAPPDQTAVVRTLLATGQAELGPVRTYQCGPYSGRGRLVIPGKFDGRKLL